MLKNNKFSDGLIVGSFIFIFSVLLLSVSLVSAYNPQITINSIDVNDLNTYGDNVYLGNGDQIVSNVSIYDEDGWNDFRRVEILFLSSNVPCSFTGTDNINTSYWWCTLTITPTMNTTNTQVTVFANSHDGINEILLGTYDFHGSAFPVPPTPISPQCTLMDVCTSYKKECHDEVISYRQVRVNECEYQIFYRDKRNRVCERIDNKRVCHIDITQVPYTKRVCTPTYINKPITKRVCEDSNICLRTTKRCI